MQKRTIEQKLTEAHREVIEALLPNGFTVTKYEPNVLPNRPALVILMLDKSSQPNRTAAVEIAEEYRETDNWCGRTFKVTFHVNQVTVSADGYVKTDRKMQGAIQRELSSGDRFAYDMMEFLTSKEGLSMLEIARADIERCGQKLDLLARCEQLLKRAKSILRTDKEQHGTLLDSTARTELLDRIAKYTKLSEQKRQSWAKKVEALLKKPQAALAVQANTTAFKPRASEAQLRLLAARFNRQSAAS